MLRRIKTAAFESIQGRIFYGWVILVVAMLGMFGTGPGQSHLIGIFFDSLATDLELPRTSVAAAYGSATLVAAFLLPQVGKLVDRFGAAGLMWILVLCMGLAAVMFSMAFNWIYIAIGFGFLCFLGQRFSATRGGSGQLPEVLRHLATMQRCGHNFFNCLFA